MSEFLLQVGAFGLLLSSAFAEKSLEQLDRESIWGNEGVRKDQVERMSNSIGKAFGATRECGKTRWSA
jgi:hypothetical protein